MRAVFARAAGIAAALVLVGAFVAGAIAHSDAPTVVPAASSEMQAAATPLDLEPVLAGGCMLLVLCCAIGLAMRGLSTRGLPSRSAAGPASHRQPSAARARPLPAAPSLLVLSISRT